MWWQTLAVLLASTTISAAGGDETPTRVTGRLDGRTARLTARYSLSVGANQGSNQTLLELPPAAVVTGARVSRDGATHRLELMKADVADAKFDALSVQKAGRGAKPSAVLIAEASGRVAVSVASPRAGRIVIDLEIAMPTCFYRDTRWAVVPWSWDDAAARSLRRSEPDGESLGQICGRSGEGEIDGSWIGFASTETTRRKSGDRVSVSADRVDLGDESFVRLELDVASMLADVPRDLATVLIVDGSRSLSVNDRAAQRALLASYLAKAPRSQIQVVSFARTAQALLPEWTDAASARASVDQALRFVVPRNGSNFDVALAEAATWLARIDGTRRVVLVTDQRMATRLSSMSDASLQRMLPAGAVLQVVVVGPGTGLTRDNELRLGSLATLTGGIAATLGNDNADAEVDATILVRPVSVDRLKIVASGWEPVSHEHGAQDCTEGLDVVEGKACTWWAAGQRASVAPITVEGWVWGKRLTRIVTPDRTHDLDVARELSMSGGLTEDLRERVDTRARAVNSTWSLYATWGGTAGYDGPGGGGTGWGTICGCGSMGTIGHGSGTGSGHAPEPALDLRAQLLPALESCTIGDAKIAFAIELTDIEIADVHVTARNLPTADRQRVEACVAEVVWASSPKIPRPRDHQVVSFTVAH